MRMLRKLLFVTSLVLTCLLTVATVARAGHYYETVTEGRTEGERKGHHMKIRGWVDGDRARVEFASGEKKGWFADGNYMVTTDGAENSYLVNPKEEQYTRFSLSEMMATLGQTMNMLENMGGMVKLEFTEHVGEKLLEEPGEDLLGLSTTHYRYNSGYTMSMKMMGINRKTEYATVTDIWSTDELSAKGFGVWMNMDEVPKTGNEGLDKILEQEMASFKGLPLKLVLEGTTTGKKGKSQKSTTTMEMTVLREESVDGIDFGWPDHYTETEMIPELDMEAMKADKKDKKKKKD